MAQVSVLGLGAMGSTLARVLLERGHELTVWNRSDSERAAAVCAAGAARAATPAAAVSAAPLVLMCVTDYPAADEVLAAPGVLDGTRRADPRAADQRQRGAGARAAGAGARRRRAHAGRRHPRLPAPHRAAGDGDHVRRRRRRRSRSTRRRWRTSPGRSAICGEDPGPPNAVYVAAFGFYFAALAGFLEAAALAESRGVAPAEFAAAMPGMTALLLDHIDDAARRIETDDYAGDQATVDVHLVGSERRRRTMADAGLESLATGAFVEYCRRAQAAGEGGEDIAALFKPQSAGAPA